MTDLFNETEKGIFLYTLQQLPQCGCDDVIVCFKGQLKVGVFYLLMFLLLKREKQNCSSCGPKRSGKSHLTCST